MSKKYTSDKGDPTTSVTTTLPETHYDAFLFLRSQLGGVSNSELLRNIVTGYLEQVIDGMPEYRSQLNGKKSDGSNE